MSDEPKLTDEEAEAMLARLSRHYGEPVMPIDRYCAALSTWGRVIGERLERHREELFPNIKSKDDAKQSAAYKAYSEAMDAVDAGNLKPGDDLKRWSALLDLHTDKTLAHEVAHVFLQIRKSNLLARLLYNGEKLRTKMCPEHKGKWTGIEWGNNRCPPNCQLTGWIQEETDAGKPLPGVQAVQLVPVGEGKAVMVRDVDGKFLGQVAGWTEKK